jgi:hypothetical protein
MALAQAASYSFFNGSSPQACGENVSGRRLDDPAQDVETWKSFETALPIDAPVRLEVRYSFDALWDALPSVLRAPVSAAEHGSPIRLGFQNRVPIGTYMYRPDDCPRHVQLVAAAIGYAARVFEQLGFLPPHVENGGPLIVTLRNCDGFRGHTSIENNHIALERSLVGEPAALTAAHELFHRIQYAYILRRIISSQFRPMLVEGGARFAEDIVFDLADRYAEERRIWFTTQNTSLLTWPSPPTSRPPAISYQASLFWKYIAEQGGLPRRQDSRNWEGAETQRTVLETLRADKALDESFADLLARSWNKLEGLGHFDRIWHSPGNPSATVCSDTLWGNFAAALVLNGTGTPDSRFAFGESRFWVRERHDRMHIPPSQTFAFGSLPMSGSVDVANDLGTVRVDPAEPARVRQRQYPASDVPPVRMLQPYAVRGYRVTIPEGGADVLLRVSFDPDPAFADALLQILTFDAGGGLDDLIRLDAEGATSLQQVVPCLGLSEVIVLVCARRTAGDFSLRFTRDPPASLPFMTSWNTPVGKHLPLDPRRFVWSWTSPDMEISRYSGGIGVKCVVRNHGTLSTAKVEVRLHEARLSDLLNDQGDPWTQVADPQFVESVMPRGLCMIAHEQETDPNRRCDIRMYGAHAVTFTRGGTDATLGYPLADTVLRASLFVDGRPVGTGGTAFTCIAGGAPSQKPGWRLARRG